MTCIDKLRDDNVDVGNIEFHLVNELRVKVPSSWNSIKNLIEAINNTSCFVFYSDTNSYRSFHDLAGENERIGYSSFYELHYAIIHSAEDIRFQQKIS